MRAGSSAGTTGRSFTTESSPFICTPSSANDDAVSVERQVGRVEEEHLADLGVEWIDPQRGDGGDVIGLRHRELQLDAVGSLDQREQAGAILVGECAVSRAGCAHSFPPSLAV